MQVLNQDESAVYGFPIQADGSIGTLANTSNGSVAANSRNLSSSPSGAAFYAGNQNNQFLTVYNATVPPTNPVLVTNSLGYRWAPLQSDLQGSS